VIERDQELQKLLRQWKAPASRSALDKRVWNSVRRSESSRGVSWGAGVRRWLPVAAVLFVAATLWLGHKAPATKSVPGSQHDVSIRTTADATGFRPIENDSITVVRLQGKQ
jgi:hypothetical protein